MSKLHNGRLIGWDGGRAPYSGVRADLRLGPVMVSAGINEHSKQCDQRWRFRFRLSWKGNPRHLRGGWKHAIIGYRTRGDATPNIATYHDGGFWWPWQISRTCAGAY